MRSLKLKVLFIGLMFLGVPLWSQNNAKNWVQQTINAYEDSVLAKNYGITALVKKDGETHQGFIGMAAPEDTFSENHLYNIGSLTKTFTAVLVLQEIEKGNLSLTDTVGAFFPPNENVDPSISIEELLRHRSGLGELAVDSLMNPAFQNPYHAMNHAFLYNKIPKPTGNRGEYDYTSTNYDLLGDILEMVNDQPYHKILQERILEPTEMHHTRLFVSKHNENLAHPIFNRQDLIEQFHHRFYSHCGGASGGIFSTNSDLLKFFEQLFEEKTLINEQSLKQMTTFNERYGFGLKRWEINGKAFWGHRGDNISYAVQSFYNPTTGNVMLMGANTFTPEYFRPIGANLLKQM